MRPTASDVPNALASRGSTGVSTTVHWKLPMTPGYGSDTHLALGLAQTEPTGHCAEVEQLNVAEASSPPEQAPSTTVAASAISARTASPSGLTSHLPGASQQAALKGCRVRQEYPAASASRALRAL